MRGGQPGADVGGNARRASATRGCARGRNSGAGAQGERQDGPEQIVHVGVPDRAGQIVADHPVRGPAGAQRRVSEAIFRGIPLDTCTRTDTPGTIRCRGLRGAAALNRMSSRLRSGRWHCQRPFFSVKGVVPLGAYLTVLLEREFSQ